MVVCVEPGHAIGSAYFVKLGEVLQAAAVVRRLVGHDASCRVEVSRRHEDIEIRARPLGRDFVVGLPLSRVRKHHDATFGEHE